MNLASNPWRNYRAGSKKEKQAWKKTFHIPSGLV
jgi:hypothetical protein